MDGQQYNQITSYDGRIITTSLTSTAETESSVNNATPPPPPRQQRWQLPLHHKFDITGILKQATLTHEKVDDSAIQLITFWTFALTHASADFLSFGENRWLSREHR